LDDFEKQLKEAEFEWLKMYQAGPQHIRWDKLPPQVGDDAPDFTRLNSQGEETKLSDFWKDGPALILFWRHFGCGCGLDRSARLINELQDIERAGARVVIIGQGEPARSAYYALKYELEEIPILSDTDFSAYFEYGLLEGKESQILFDAPTELIDRQLQAGKDFAASRKKDERPLVDNPWLMPGEFVVDQQGKLRLTYRYNFCEDFPDARVLLTAIREARLAVE
jgi:peroxiredoxin